MTEDQLSTMDQYKYRLCFYVDQVSTNNCKDGNLTSLPLESSNVLWNIMFDNKFDNQSDASFNNTNVTHVFAEKTDVSILVIMGILFTLVFIVSFIYIFFRIRRIWRAVKEDNRITIPADDLDTNGPSLDIIDIIHKDRNDDGLTMLENKNQLEYEDESSAVESFKYNISQRLKNYKYAQHFGIWQRTESFYKEKLHVENNLRTGRSKTASNTKKETMQNDEIKCMETLGSQNGCEDKFYKENKSSLDLNVKCEEVQHVRSPNRETTPHVVEATDKHSTECHYNKSNKEKHDEPPVTKSRDGNESDVSNKTGDHDDDNAVVPVDENKNKLNGTDKEDYTRYNWTEIFTYLAQEIIDPKKYFLFFNILLADAGYDSPEKKISVIEENTKGNIVRTLIEIFHLWKDRVGSKINPKDIEDTFEKLEWNTQLHTFKIYLRNPPLLKDRNTMCKHWNEQDKRWNQLVEDHNNLPEFTNFGRVPIFPDDESIHLSEEVVFEHKQNGDKILKRKKRVVRKVSDRKRLKKDLNGYCINSNTVNNKMTRQSISHKQRLKRAKNAYHRDKTYKHPVIKPFILDENCFENSSDSFSMISDNCYTNQGRNGDNSFDSVETSSKSTTEEKNVSNIDSGFGSSCFTSEMSHINSNQSSHEKQVKVNAVDPTRQCQTSQGTNYAIKTKTGHEQHGPNQTTFQRGYSCQATSSVWDVRPNLLKKTNNVKEKRHIESNRDDLENCCLKKMKTGAGSVSIKTCHKRSKNSVNWKQKFRDIVPRLVHHIESSFESRNPVHQEDFNIFINDLLTRLTDQPQKHDIVSLKLQSYETAQVFTCNNNRDVIHVISTEKHSLYLKEREWTSLKTYVECARPNLVKKTQVYGFKQTDFLFLNYDGKPWAQKS